MLGAIVPGSDLGSYRIVEKVGQGGMAAVYKAYQASLSRFVAIKILPAQLANDPDFQTRFREEAVAVAGMRHPNILAVHDFGEIGGITFIVNEFVDGGTLDQQMGAPLPVSYVTEMLQPIASALDYAHSRGLIHRDVKPSNILITHEGKPMLGDFGLARMMMPDRDVTQTGMILGTPAYMAPEQGQGEAGPASDTYSLGVVAFEALTGSVPYKADTPMAVVLAHQVQPMPMPRSINPDLSEGVQTVLLRGMARAPEDRYASAETFVKALRSPGRRGSRMRAGAGVAAAGAIGAAAIGAAPASAAGPPPAAPSGPPSAASGGPPSGPPQGTAGAPSVSAAGPPPSTPGGPPPGPPPGAPQVPAGGPPGPAAGPPPSPPGSPPAGGYSGPPPGGPTGRSPDRRPTGVLALIMEHREIVVAVAVVALLAAIVGGSLLINRPAQAQGDDVAAQSASTPGDNAFSPSVAAPATSPSAVPSPPPSKPNPTGVDGTSAGLYGGTQNNASCDRTKLIDYLKANPDKAAAWAAVENIRVDEIPAYILSLTPVVLRYDMWVTNHGYANGVATPYQAVLQAGTAVLVDHYGTPRARCYCGNPLLPALHPAHPRYTGSYWRGFSSTTIIVVIIPSQPVTTLTLADPNGKGMGRKVGTDGTKPGDDGNPPGPDASPSPFPSPNADPRSGNYSVDFSGGGTTPIGGLDCTTFDGELGRPTRMDVVVGGGMIAIRFLNAQGSGSLLSDGSFSIDFNGTFLGSGQTGRTDTMTGQLAGNKISAFWKAFTDPSGSRGCSHSLTATKVQ